MISNTIVIVVLIFLNFIGAFSKASSMFPMNNLIRLPGLRNGMLSIAMRNSYSSLIKKPSVIFVLGGPGAGKGTQCEKLANEFGIKHLSAGELLREEQGKPTADGRLIDSYLREGKIVPVEISLGLLKKSIVGLKWNRYLIDGFPRNWDNLEGWNKQMNSVCDLESVLFIECNEQELEKRILSRGTNSGRDDDNLESARKRFATFRRETMPVIEHFKKTIGDKTIVVNGDQPIDSVYDDLVRSVKDSIAKELYYLTKEKFGENGETKVGIVSCDVNGCEANVVYIHEVIKEGKLERTFGLRKWTMNNGQWTCN